MTQLAIGIDNQHRTGETSQFADSVHSQKISHGNNCNSIHLQPFPQYSRTLRDGSWIILHFDGRIALLLSRESQSDCRFTITVAISLEWALCDHASHLITRWITSFYTKLHNHSGEEKQFSLPAGSHPSFFSRKVCTCAHVLLSPVYTRLLFQTRNQFKLIRLRVNGPIHL